MAKALRSEVRRQSRIFSEMWVVSIVVAAHHGEINLSPLSDGPVSI